MPRLTRIPVPLLAATLILGLAWGLLIGGAMREAARPDPHITGVAVNQLRLEFAGTSGNASALLTRWGEQSAERMRDVIHLDFDFIPAYVLLLGSLVLLAARVSSPDARLSGGLLLGMIVAGGMLDAVENGAMLIWLRDASPSPAPTIATAAAIAKWLLVLFATGAGIVKLVRSVRVRPPAPASALPDS